MTLIRFLCIFTLLPVISLSAAGCSKEPADGGGTSTLKLKQPADLSDQALNILNTKCVVCHTAERFEKRQFTAQQWDEVIQRMVAKGAQLSGDEMKVLRHWSDGE